MSSTSQPTTPAPEPSLFSPLRVTAYSTSALVGGTAARIYISDSAYDNMKRVHAFDDLLKPHHETIDRLTSEAVKAPMEANHGFANILRGERMKYFPQIGQRMQHLGIRGLSDEWKVIHRSQRQNSGIIGLTVGSVLLGGILSIANNIERQPATPQR